MSVTAAAAAARIKAMGASGVVVKVAPDAFAHILRRQQAPLVIHATGGLFSKSYRYLTSYKGLAFFTKSSDALSLPGTVELVLAKKIWIPG